MKRILSRITPAVKHLFLLNIAIYLITIILQEICSIRIEQLLGAYTSASDQFNPIQIITYMFIHDIVVLHVIGNMLIFLLFAPNFERRYGYRLTLITYLICGISSYICFNIGISLEKYFLYGSSGAVIGFCVLFLINNVFNWKKILYNALTLLLIYQVYALFQKNEIGYHMTAYGHLGGLLGSLIVLLYIQFKRA